MPRSDCAAWEITGENARSDRRGCLTSASETSYRAKCEHIETGREDPGLCAAIQGELRRGNGDVCSPARAQAGCLLTCARHFVPETTAHGIFALSAHDPFDF